METKVCAHCGLTKPTSEFYKSNKSKDGLAYSCKSCTRESIKASQQKKTRQ